MSYNVPFCSIHKDMDTVELIANESRGLCLDMVNQAQSGHLGLPLGCADCFAVLFGSFLKFLPQDPRWINRDRLILSAGHGSALLYAYLHLAGFDVSMEDLKQFRQFKSHTPGHPEFGVTPGVEATTGPLGQGIGNAVGMAVSQKKLAAFVNTSDEVIVDNKVVCVCGDGCLQEGVGLESIALAGLWQLDNLILIYDNNHVTLDAPAAKSQNSNVRMTFEANGWQVYEVDGHDCAAIEKTLKDCRQQKGRPKAVILNTIIGKGLSIAGTPKAHGAAGIAEVAQVKQQWRLDADKTFAVSETTRRFFEKRRAQLQKQYNAWSQRFEQWCQKYPERARQLAKPDVVRLTDDDLIDLQKDQATRVALGKLLNKIAQRTWRLLTGSADLFESVKNYITDGKDFSGQNPDGRNLFFGIREHAMGAILNGIAYDGFFQASGSTFFSFSDYLKPAVRLAALSHLPVWFFFSHDSIAVGEDGPTHQPIEQLVSLRSIPNIQVFRPADVDELAASFNVALVYREGPSVFVLSRQTLPYCNQLPAFDKLNDAMRGGYILKKEVGTLDTILIASGSEVALALKTADLLGNGVRVVSMPSCEVFLHQDKDYQERVLPKNCRKRIAIEAGSSLSWHRFVGMEGAVIGLDHFGMSAPAEKVIKYFGFSPEKCAEDIKKMQTKNRL